MTRLRTHRPPPSASDFSAIRLGDTCLHRAPTFEAIRAIAERKPSRVVLLDEGFAKNDQLEASAVQLFRTQGVASFRTV